MPSTNAQPRPKRADPATEVGRLTSALTQSQVRVAYLEALVTLYDRLHDAATREAAALTQAAMDRAAGAAPQN
jgi:hypothetical protein